MSTLMACSERCRADLCPILGSVIARWTCPSRSAAGSAGSPGLAVLPLPPFPVSLSWLLKLPGRLPLPGRAHALIAR